MPAVLWADDDKYLAGAVPEIDGKVVFAKEFDLSGVEQNSIYDYVYDWLDGRMKAINNESRIVYADKEKGQIVASGEEYLMFANNALSLDRSILNYNLVVLCKPGKCEMQIERIRYNYENKKYTAEEMIADNVALNKKKDAIFRGYKKFRINTVDYADALFEGARVAFGIKNDSENPTLVAEQSKQTTLLPADAPANNVTAPATTGSTVPVQNETTASIQNETVISAHNEAKSKQNEEPAPVRGTETPSSQAPASVPAVASNTPQTEPSSLQGYKQLSPDKIPGNIIKILNEDWMIITAGTDEKFNMMTAGWGGLGVLYSKPVAICFINPLNYTYQFMETSDTYTFTFYTEAYREALRYCGSNSGRDTDKVKGSGLTPITTPLGSKAFSEAWLIIECRKLVGQSLSHDTLFDEKVKAESTGKQLPKMFIGEIINVWVK